MTFKTVKYIFKNFFFLLNLKASQMSCQQNLFAFFFFFSFKYSVTKRSGVSLFVYIKNNNVAPTINYPNILSY